ncbi:TetR-like C-terminal domain-containing protein [Streptomyces niveus]|uniref:TetR-like C-terminal domain-containing protein n=1 Tax=Streptomyces niveus TaxID=193462 RepID=UPI003660E164
MVRDSFADLDEHLRTAMDAVGDEPRARLTALCHSYLEFALARPGRYRIMFGGLWTPDTNASSVTEEDVATLGQASLDRLAEALADCVAADSATSDDPAADPAADAVALWLGLHGLAERVITALAHFTDDGAGRGR